MTKKVLGKIIRAEFGIDKDYPELTGLQLTFSFNAGCVSSGTKYMSINFIDVVCRLVRNLLLDANVSYVSQLIGKPVEITIKDNCFDTFRILTELL